jgi:hypothetical protein
VSGSHDIQPTWSLLLKIKKGDEILKIFISETTGPIGTTARQNFERGSITKGLFLEKLESNWPSSFRGKQIKCHPPFLFLATVNFKNLHL